jgi:predicted component of type VI protein secretion system
MNTRLIIAAVVVIGMSGCASQATGGSKLDHIEVVAAQNLNNDTIQVCDQAGAVMVCRTEDRQQVEQDLEYMLQSVNYQR